jgi:hypothetical protein
MTMIIFGCTYIIEAKKILLIEFFCQILSLIAMVDFYETANLGYSETVTSVQLFNLVSLFRMLRLLYMLSELKQF